MEEVTGWTQVPDWSILNVVDTESQAARVVVKHIDNILAAQTVRMALTSIGGFHWWACK